MEHFFHIFIPGTPENMAWVQMLPVFAPVWNQIFLSVKNARQHWRVWRNRK